MQQLVSKLSVFLGGIFISFLDRWSWSWLAWTCSEWGRVLPWTQYIRHDDWRLAEADWGVNLASNIVKHEDVSQYWRSRFRIQFQESVFLVQAKRGRDEEFQYEEDVEDPSQCFVDWNSPLTYDTYINDEDLIKVSFLSYGQEVEQQVDNCIFNESPKGEIFQWGFQQINYVYFFGIENFLTNFHKEHLDIFLSI
jgi:hypothetical protein